MERPLAECLAEVSRASGLTVRLGRQYEDRRSTLAVQRLPLRTLLTSLARLYGDEWRYAGRGKERALDLVPGAARVAVERRLRAGLLAVLQEELVLRARALAGGEVPEGIPAAAVGSDYDLQGEFQARGRILTLLAPSQMAELFAGAEIRLPIAEAPGPGGEILRRFLEDYAMPGRTGWRPQQRATAWIHYFTRRYSLNSTALQGLPLFGLDFVIGTAEGRSSVYGIVASPQRLMEQVEQLVRREPSEREPPAAERRRAMGRAVEEQVPDQPELRGQAGLTRGAVHLARATNLALVADAHTHPPQTAPNLAQGSVEAALDRIGAQYSSRWRGFRGVALVRSRYWWWEDAAEPPARLLEEMVRTLAQSRPLSLPQALELARLPAVQQERASRRVPGAGALFRVWMRLLAALPPGERERALTPDGLPLAALPPAVRQTLVRRPADDPQVGSRSAEGTAGHPEAVLRVRGLTATGETTGAVSRGTGSAPTAGGTETGHGAVAGLRFELWVPRRAAEGGSREAGAGGRGVPIWRVLGEEVWFPGAARKPPG